MARYELKRDGVHRFWGIDLRGPTLTVRAGVVGQKGREKTLRFKDESAARSKQNELYFAKFDEGYRAVLAPRPVPKARPLPCPEGFRRALSFSRATLDPKRLAEVVRTCVKGRFAGSTIRRLASAEAKDRAAGPGHFDPSTDVLLHDGNLALKGDLLTSRKPWIRMLVVRGDLRVHGLLEDSLDPESIVIVTGSLYARDVISEGFLEVHGDLCAERSALFLDNDGCAEIMGDLRAPFVYTKYHAVKVHGRVRATLATGDAAHIRAAKGYGFVEETEPGARKALSEGLLRALHEEVFDEADLEEGDPWIDYISSEKLAGFVRRGGNPLRQPNKRR